MIFCHLHKKSDRLTCILCFIGGANLDILKKCSTEKNGFIATGVGIINVVLISTISMYFTLLPMFTGKSFLLIIISIFYGFIIFISYWGILSVIRKSAKYTSLIKLFSFIAIFLISFLTANAIARYLIDINFLFHLQLKQYLVLAFVILLSVAVNIIPVIIKMLIDSSTYEEEIERIEHNFISQKEADIIAYREKYQDYALSFNEATIKLESVKNLTDISKEYHVLLEKLQKETFEYINSITKANQNGNQLLEKCKSNVEKNFEVTLEKMSKIFNGI